MVELKEYILKKNRPVYMPYLTVGDPDFEKTVEFAVGMIDAGADLLELGIPFSDPTADGPTIQGAMVRALNRPDFSLEGVFETVRKIHKMRPDIPLIFLTYLNPVLNGFKLNGNDKKRKMSEKEWIEARIEYFLMKCEDSGIRGIVIPDLPYASIESYILQKISRKYNISPILMVAPNTDGNRLEQICLLADGFIYYVTSYGVTGERKALPPDMKRRIKEIKRISHLPVFAGFGFNHPSQIAGLESTIDGVIVGSLNHRIIEEFGGAATASLSRITSEFSEALKSAKKGDK